MPPEVGVSSLFTSMDGRRVVATSGCCLILCSCLLYELLFLEYMPFYSKIIVTRSLTEYRYLRVRKFHQERMSYDTGSTRICDPPPSVMRGQFSSSSQGDFHFSTWIDRGLYKKICVIVSILTELQLEVGHVVK